MCLCAGKRKQRNAVKIAVPVLVIVTCISLSWFCIFRGKNRILVFPLNASVHTLQEQRNIMVINFYGR